MNILFHILELVCNRQIQWEWLRWHDNSRVPQSSCKHLYLSLVEGQLIVQEIYLRILLHQLLSQPVYSVFKWFTESLQVKVIDMYIIMVNINNIITQTTVWIQLFNLFTSCFLDTMYIQIIIFWPQYLMIQLKICTCKMDKNIDV